MRDKSVAWASNDADPAREEESSQVVEWMPTCYTWAKGTALAELQRRGYTPPLNRMAKWLGCYIGTGETKVQMPILAMKLTV